MTAFPKPDRLADLDRPVPHDRSLAQADRATAVLRDMALGSETKAEMAEPDQIHDDELRLIFARCHPSLAPDARIALTSWKVGGLTTEEVARAFLARPAAIAQRIVRAKAGIRDEAIPYVVPDRGELPERPDGALHMLDLIFNEGYAATSGSTLIRAWLCFDAIRLARLVADLVDNPEAQGLVALMLLHKAHRAARVDADRDIILLLDQDRRLWDRDGIAEAARHSSSTHSRPWASAPLSSAGRHCRRASAAWDSATCLTGSTRRRLWR